MASRVVCAALLILSEDMKLVEVLEALIHRLVGAVIGPVPSVVRRQRRVDGCGGYGSNV